MLTISVITGCFNEEGNVEELYRRLSRVFAEKLSAYQMELIFIDNASTDNTVNILRRLAAADRRVKVIVNNRNFGHIRSGYHAFLQASGSVVIAMVSDLQDPPELLPDFVEKWEKGSKVVLARKATSSESRIMFWLRGAYYRTLRRFSDVDLVEQATGFGLYDRSVVEEIRKLRDPYPYFRGLIAELGFKPEFVEFHQPRRISGITKNNFYTLWDLAMLGLITHSRIPLRLATFLGGVVAFLSVLVGIFYAGLKLILWDQFQAGTAPLVIGIFFIGAVQLLFIGVLGEYIGAIYTQILNRPVVVERERINF